MRPARLTLAALFLLMGVTAAASGLGMQAFGETGENLSIYPGAWLHAIGLGGVLTDAAHGPPFLNLAGIAVVYLLPAFALGWPPLRRKERR